MKKPTVMIITLIIAATAIYSAIEFKLLSEKSKEIKQITLKHPQEKEIEKKSETINFYIPDKNFTKLISQKGEIASNKPKEELIRRIFTSYYGMLKESNLNIPEPVILNTFFDGGDLYINLGTSGELTNSESKTLVLLYGLTNTITDFLNVRRVKFLLNGIENNGIFNQFYEKNLNI